MDEQDDAELVGRCVRGDPEAFEPLVARYQRVLFNVALRMVNDYEDARDVTQNAFVKAYEKLDTYDAHYKFFSWIYRIMMNEALNLLKRRRARDPLDPDLPSPSNPQAEVEAREVSRRVQAAVLTLPVDSREVVILRHFVELSYEEMSDILSLPEKTVKSRLFTARRRLAQVLLEEGAPR